MKCQDETSGSSSTTVPPGPGVIEIRPKPDGPGSTYAPTLAGRELSEIMFALENWGRKWAELKPEHARHPGVVLWAWRTFFLNRDRLPRRRVLVRFEYPTLPGSGHRSWLLIERGHAGRRGQRQLNAHRSVR